LEQIEAKIETLEIQKLSLQNEINRSGSDYTRLTELAGQLQQLEAELESITERWLELSELAEG
jgi:ATP-binding cassette subfamily F protein uup